MVSAANNSFSQTPVGYMLEFHTMPNYDTLKVDRYYGEWWFGLFGGPNVNLFFGDLYSKINEGSDSLVSFNSVFGGGFYFGGLAEYKPRGERWAYSLGISFFDRKAFTSSSDKLDDSLKTQYEYKSILDYLIISPQVKYYSSLAGLYYYGGLDVGINLATDAKQATSFINSGNIKQFTKVPGVKANTRLEINLGVGYEFLLADVAGIGRILGNPYISLNSGTNVISDFKSNWNTIGFKIGFALKFGKDHREFDTLKFDENYEEPAQYLAQVAVEGVEFAGFKRNETVVSAWLAYVEQPVIEEEIAEVEVPQFNEELRQRDQGQIRRRIVPNQMTVFNFDKSETTSLSREIQQYLDLLSDYLKSNPNIEIRITGHSDNQGSLSENTQRATNRANNARNYLVRNKGIPANRVLVTSRGALIPVAPNDTPSNQRKNRRIEIIVVPR